MLSTKSEPRMEDLVSLLTKMTEEHSDQEDWPVIPGSGAYVPTYTSNQVEDLRKNGKLERNT